VDADDRDQVLEATRELVSAVVERNALTSDDIISILFTATPDLVSEFPALAARELGMGDVPLMCATEIGVPHALPRVLRLMAHVETDRSRADIQHVYLRGAVALRRDIAHEHEPGDGQGERERDERLSGPGDPRRPVRHGQVQRRPVGGGSAGRGLPRHRRDVPRRHGRPCSTPASIPMTTRRWPAWSPGACIEVGTEAGTERVQVDGADVAERIRQCGGDPLGVGGVGRPRGAPPAGRAAAVAGGRRRRRRRRGPDIGTVVLPDADAEGLPDRGPEVPGPAPARSWHHDAAEIAALAADLPPRDEYDSSAGQPAAAGRGRGGVDSTDLDAQASSTGRRAGRSAVAGGGTRSRAGRCRSSRSSAGPTSASPRWSTGSWAARRRRPGHPACTRDRIAYEALWNGKRSPSSTPAAGTRRPAAGRLDHPQAEYAMRPPTSSCSSSTARSAPPTPTWPPRASCGAATGR
jgi:chorismate mutase